MAEIVVTPGRMQPFAVWSKGQIIKFTATRAEAEATLAAEERYLASKV